MSIVRSNQLKSTAIIIAITLGLPVGAILMALAIERDQTNERAEPPQIDTTSNTILTDRGRLGFTYITLPDGMRCIIYHDGIHRGKGGISCDWSKQSNE